jgi:hypothetical protein
MKRALWLLWSLVLLTSVPAWAQLGPRERTVTMFSVTGEDEGGTGAHGLAVGWSLDRDYRNVSISARMNNGGGPAAGVAYLMRAIGPGASPADEVAREEFDLPLPFDGMVPLFKELDLRAGTYWLVFSRPLDGRFSYANWLIARSPTMRTSRGVKFIGTTWPVNFDAANPYIPHSYFIPSLEWVAYQLQVTGDRAAVWPQDRDEHDDDREKKLLP